MEDYIGKICPFCKTEILEGDAVKVCPECGIPHHAACWKENKGCTTFGCPEQHYEEQRTNPTDVCVKCGAPLGDGQEFCPKCGTPKGGEKKRVCSKCGAELQDGQEFCPKCGQKADLQIDAGVNSAISQFNAGVNKANDAKKKKPIKAIIAAVIALAVIVAGVLVVPKIFVSVEDLCAQGNYEKAYAKASGSEKNEVLAENVIAYLSMESSDSLKDPSSFSLRDAYYNVSYNEEKDRIYQQAVLYISGANSYGASVSSYWLWVADEYGDWSFFGTCSRLNLDSDDDDYLTSLVARVVVESDNAIKLSKTSVKNINTQFENDTLYQVAPIDNNNLDTSVMPTSSSSDD